MSKKIFKTTTTHEYKIQPRSNAYQYQFFEIPMDDDCWSFFTNKDSLSSQLSNGFSYNERILVLQDQLTEAFWSVAKATLTDHQFNVIYLLSQGLGQKEVAEKLNIGQSTVAKALLGNTTYKNGKKRYGGIIKKLRPALDKDILIQTIFKQIAELQNPEE